MFNKRSLIKTYTPKAQQGFLGQGHTAKPVIQVPYSESDPFIMLMDDVLDKKDEKPAGGPHPHAGFETVSLLLEGELGDETHKMQRGDFQLMTAGSGIIHTETIDKVAKMRLLQLWLTLPKKERWTQPRIQDIAFENVPKLSKNGLDIKVYSGSLAGLSSPVENHVPIIVADIRLEPHITTALYIPSSYTTFLYMLAGDIKLGDPAKTLDRDQVGWLDRFSDDTPSELNLAAGGSGSRVILYSAQPQGDEIVSYGPFIGNTQEDIRRLYHEYNQGKMNHINTVDKSQKWVW